MSPLVTRRRRPPPQTPAERKRERRQHVLETLVGALGFFTLISFVATVIAEVRGESALGQALVLLVFVVLLVLVYRLWRRT
ncbi:MAG TPA: hypothetical protein VFJ19_19005 [Nocardioidaceae bacterium]|nr:hypothetical protein [Nocardioidaceae bacterium]